MNLKTMDKRESKNYEIAKALAAIAVTSFILIFFISWPPKHLHRPPLHLTKIIRVKALSKPWIPRKQKLVEMKGESNSEYLKWWYFSNVGSIHHGINIGDFIDVWVSDVDDPAFGGRGYIWQVLNISKNTLLITPNQIAEHNNTRYYNTLVYLYILISMSFMTAIGAIHYYRMHRLDKVK